MSRRAPGHASVEEHPKGSGKYRTRARVEGKLVTIDSGLTEPDAQKLATAYAEKRTQFMTLNELAKLLGVSSKTVVAWTGLRGLPGARLGRIWRFNRASVETWIAQDFSLAMQVVSLPGIRAPESQGVYCVLGPDQAVKIGRAANIRKRLATLQGAHPARLKLLAVLSVDPNYEKAFHFQFRDLRAMGEWFCLGAELAHLILERRGLVDLLSAEVAA